MVNWVLEFCEKIVTLANTTQQFVTEKFWQNSCDKEKNLFSCLMVSRPKCWLLIPLFPIRIIKCTNSLELLPYLPFNGLRRNGLMQCWRDFKIVEKSPFFRDSKDSRIELTKPSFICHSFISSQDKLQPSKGSRRHNWKKVKQIKTYILW